MPKQPKINHGKAALEVDVLHRQLEAEMQDAVGRFSQRFIQAVDQLITANPRKLRLVQQYELDLEFPGMAHGPNQVHPVQRFPTRYISSSVYITLVYDELLLLELSPGPEGGSLRVQFKEKPQNNEGILSYPCGRRRWGATIYSFDKALVKAHNYCEFLRKLLADKQPFK